MTDGDVERNQSVLPSVAAAEESSIKFYARGSDPVFPCGFWDYAVVAPLLEAQDNNNRGARSTISEEGIGSVWCL